MVRPPGSREPWRGDSSPQGRKATSGGRSKDQGTSTPPRMAQSATRKQIDDRLAAQSERKRLRDAEEAAAERKFELQKVIIETTGISKNGREVLFTMDPDMTKNRLALMSRENVNICIRIVVVAVVVFLSGMEAQRLHLDVSIMAGVVGVAASSVAAGTALGRAEWFRKIWPGRTPPDAKN